MDTTKEILTTELHAAIERLFSHQRSIRAAQELYQEMVDVDFSTIRGLSNSAHVAQSRRGVYGAVAKEHQTTEIDFIMQNYRALNRAVGMQKTVKTIPKSVVEFLLVEQVLIKDVFQKADKRKTKIANALGRGILY